MTSQLPMVQARIMLIHLLRRSAPPLTHWDDEVLGEGQLLARELVDRLDEEVARRSR